MSKLDGANLQIGSNATATQNCTLTANGDGTFTLARGNVGATTDDILKVDGSTTAGDTRFLIYDVDNGTMERVTVGAADSGGVGFKLLRILN